MKKLFSQALATANSIHDEIVRYFVHREIVKTLVKAGTMAPAIANSIHDNWTKSQTLRGISEALAKSGDIEQAIAIANSMRDNGTKSQAFRGIAETLVKSGDIEKASKFFFKAIAAANSIHSTRGKALVLNEIVTTIANIPIKDKDQEVQIAQTIMAALDN